MKFSKEYLLPRIKRRNDTELEKFIVNEINKELENLKNTDRHYDLVQMQHFLESAFDDRDKREELLRKLKHNGKEVEI
jgi:tRNA A37 N6-isopentenylltransferase MiaA